MACAELYPARREPLICALRYEIVAHREFRAGRVFDRGQGGERHHLRRRYCAHRT